MNVPFTPEQVLALRRWQAADTVHPFTCCNHMTMEVYEHGFVCPKCARVQTWCHDFMLEEPPTPSQLLGVAVKKPSV